MFTPRLALSSLSGESDAGWAKDGAEYAGAAFLGGIAIDEASREAAGRLVERDRTEFLPPDPIRFVESQLERLERESVPIKPGVNVRSATLEPIPKIARVCRDADALFEINAHCRQSELCAVGCGESLLADTHRLASYVEAATSTGATVGVKVRAEVPGVDLPRLVDAIETAGGSFVHVDAMDSESIIEEITTETSLFVIANNGVRDDETVREYVDYGADAVSVGRPSDNSRVLTRVRKAVDRRLG